MEPGTIVYFLIPLLVGWLLDLIFGDPERLPHPVVYFGKWIARCERSFNNGTARKSKGACVVVFSVAVLLSVSYVFLASLPYWLNCIVSTIMVFYCLAGKTLRREVRMVFEAVDRSTEEGRRQVARIVGRDTSELNDQEIRTAALETLAENLSDGVIAPLFWFALCGVPGMLAYKLINTFDSMIGYHSERYKDFGYCAAKLDDIVNYVPARLTALLMILATVFLGKSSKIPHFIVFTRCFGPQHASPNSGWPEAALAGILDCRFGGPHNYFGEYFYKPYIGTNERPLTTADMQLSLRICFLAECVTVLLIAALLFVSLQFSA